MKIVQLKSENVKRLYAVEINPDGSLVIINGRNAQGKTSVLDSIMFALGGASSVPGKPIRNGAGHAKIEVELERVELDNLIVERSFVGDKTYLKVYNKGDGAEYSSPQSMLNDLLGKIAFDPLAFARKTTKEQVAALLDVVDLGDVDLNTLSKERQEIYDDRTDINRERKRVKGNLDNSPPR